MHSGVFNEEETDRTTAAEASFQISASGWVRPLKVTCLTTLLLAHSKQDQL